MGSTVHGDERTVSLERGVGKIQSLKLGSAITCSLHNNILPAS
ncbi:hypothetical protein LSP04_20300 [Levilactobacillus spicheri]|uniref:Uncharacterized protein n=1 Tax=Levilactobacillus spicheri TaxID=216463 RepID=A0ABQ0WXC7_9LACO|nr:hypothetical protein LSP04_20300 [Levilactobacillus spicheri]